MMRELIFAILSCFFTQLKTKSEEEDIPQNSDLVELLEKILDRCFDENDSLSLVIHISDKLSIINKQAQIQIESDQRNSKSEDNTDQFNLNESDPYAMYANMCGYAGGGLNEIPEDDADDEKETPAKR